MSDTDIVTWLRSILHNDRSVELRCHEAANEIERLRRDYSCICNEMRRMMEERDEARRLYCIAFQEITENLGEKNTTESIAEEMKWDCFKEDSND